MMGKITTALTLAALSLPALADKYGIDEAMSESEGGIGAVIATIAVLIYVHLKG